MTKNLQGEFPQGFWWGAATAAFQVEGAANEDGKGPSIWDTFCQTPGNILDGGDGEHACEQYRRYPGDIKLMSDLGVKHYRFSIAWPRILPAGCGAVNQKGLDHYSKVVDTLLKHGITPHATLYHWDLPQALEDAYGGWRSREIVADFANYATIVAKGLGDRVSHWMTLNEIEAFTGAGFGMDKPGLHAPGGVLKSVKERAQIHHHALLAHGAACQALRAASPGKCLVSVADNYHSLVPVVETPENIEAARKAFVRDKPNGRTLVPILTGRYPDEWLADMGEEVPDIQPGDMELIAQPLDALGFNCYSGDYVRAADNAKGYEIIPPFESYPKGNMPWLNIVPESIYWGIRLVSDAVGKKNLPVFITENGMADGTDPLPSGEMLDIDRVMYFRAYLGQVRRAVAEGYPVIGYFPWSLLDNFEWSYGYSKRFGIIRVDYETQKRTPKLSYKWYQETIRKNRIA